jgi:hypothetical protein
MQPVSLCSFPFAGPIFIWGKIGRFAISRTMRRPLLLLLCLCALAGCHGVGSRAKGKQVEGQTDPDRIEAIETMNAAEAEARQQINNW